ncbi:MAG: peptide chain release factor N(5)-glutamine methyltransferase [Desulfonatronovibrio sp.]
MVTLETVSPLINEAAAALDRAGVDSPRLCARLIMAHVLGCTREKLLTYPDTPLSFDDKSVFWRLIARRSRGEPLAYITGHKEFYGLDFGVDENVLIPRPETEILVETVLNHYKSRQPCVFADIGTGSGILAVTLAVEMPSSFSLACDISPAALGVAGQNAVKHGVQGRTGFFTSDLGTGIKTSALDFIVSNPPYLSSDEFSNVSFEISKFEPYKALVSMENGYCHFRRLESIAHRILREKGMIFLEMGKDQGAHLANLFSRWKDVTVYKDLAGHDRVLSAVKKPLHPEL